MLIIPRLATCQTWTGTTLVAVGSDKELVIGADSKQRGHLSAAGETRSACKIIQSGKQVLAMAGTTEVPTYGFHVGDLFKQAAAQTSDLPTTIIRFQNLVDGPLTEIIAYVAKHFPTYFSEKLENRPALHVLIAGVDGRDLVVYDIEYRVKAISLGGEVRLSRTTAAYLVDNSTIIVRGEGKAISKYLDENLDRNPRFDRKPPSVKVKQLLELEIATGNPEIGPPIDMVRITKTGVQWIQRKSQCGETKNAPKRKKARKHR